MTFDVANIPADVPAGASCVCVVIDVIRASSTITTLFDYGCDEVWLTDKVDAFFNNRRTPEGKNLLICAENVAGNCLEGADFSPSLHLMPGREINGSPVLMQTTNGTVAVHTLIERGIDKILIGCMRNADAVMTEAVGLAAAQGIDICIVCAGRDVGTSYTIDDVYCAGQLVACGIEAARKAGHEAVLNDSARLAMMPLHCYENAAEAFADSASGGVMRKINCEADIELCARINLSASVPVLARHPEDDFLRFKRLSYP